MGAGQRAGHMTAAPAGWAERLGIATVPRVLSLDTHVVEVFPLLRPLALGEPVVNHFLRPRPVHCCRGEDAQVPPPPRPAASSPAQSNSAPPPGLELRPEQLSPAPRPRAPPGATQPRPQALALGCALLGNLRGEEGNPGPDPLPNALGVRNWLGFYLCPHPSLWPPVHPPPPNRPTLSAPCCLPSGLRPH